MNQMLEILQTQNVLAGALRRMTGFVREGSYELYLRSCVRLCARSRTDTRALTHTGMRRHTQQTLSPAPTPPKTRPHPHRWWYMNEMYCVLLWSQLASKRPPHIPQLLQVLSSSWLWNGPSSAAHSLSNSSTKHANGQLPTLEALAAAAKLARCSVWVHQAHDQKPVASAYISVSVLPEAPPRDRAAADRDARGLESWRPIGSGMPSPIVRL